MNKICIWIKYLCAILFLAIYNIVTALLDFRDHYKPYLDPLHMPNVVFAGYSFYDDYNKHDEYDICLEDTLNDGTVENIIYFNTTKELVECINEIYERNFTIGSFPLEVENGKYIYPYHFGDNESDLAMEWPEQTYLNRVHVQVKRR